MLFEAARRDRLRKDKESPLRSDLGVEPLDQQAVFMIEHRAQSGPGSRNDRPGP
jgi:hypothetical protein